MAGTVAGGKAAAETNRIRYGEDFYTIIGRKGGQISRGGCFTYGSSFAKEMGRRGGKASRRTKVDAD